MLMWGPATRTRIRFLIILETAEGTSQLQIAEMLASSVRTVASVQHRFGKHGVGMTDDYL
jgi:transposase